LNTTTNIYTGPTIVQGGTLAFAGAINALLTLGKGQRIALFSGSGVGKSILLGMMARHTAAKVCVVALIGERGRELREFIEKDWGKKDWEGPVVVAATSDVPALIRMRGAYLATAIAEYFRDQGKINFEPRAKL
jgi:flagellum-specific ATP synthase